MITMFGWDVIVYVLASCAVCFGTALVVAAIFDGKDQ